MSELENEFEQWFTEYKKLDKNINQTDCWQAWIRCYDFVTRKITNTIKDIQKETP